jgi:REP element-mobilizing transposase RayT
MKTYLPITPREGFPQEEMSYEENSYPLKGSHLLRVGRWSFPGNCYFVTASTLNRLPILTDPTCCQIVFDSIEWLEKEKKIECYCCIIMPDHIHLVMKLGPEQTLSQVMQSLKGYTASEINKLKGKKGHVWQDQYYDHLIRKEEDMRNIILYCYENPVRRNIVQEANGYPFWRCKFAIE